MKAETWLRVSEIERGGWGLREKGEGVGEMERESKANTETKKKQIKRQVLWLTVRQLHRQVGSVRHTESGKKRR